MHTILLPLFCLIIVASAVAIELFQKYSQTMRLWRIVSFTCVFTVIVCALITPATEYLYRGTGDLYYLTNLLLNWIIVPAILTVSLSFLLLTLYWGLRRQFRKGYLV